LQRLREHQPSTDADRVASPDRDEIWITELLPMRYHLCLPGALRLAWGPPAAIEDTGMDFFPQPNPIDSRAPVVVVRTLLRRWQVATVATVVRN
jgi:hypothetical protein